MQGSDASGECAGLAGAFDLTSERDEWDSQEWLSG
jgi:hypothetical protein